MKTFNLEDLTTANIGEVLEELHVNSHILVGNMRKYAQLIVDSLTQPGQRYIDRIDVFIATQFAYAILYYNNLKLPTDAEKSYDLLKKFGLIELMQGEQMTLFERFVDQLVDDYELQHSFEEEARRNALEATESLKKIADSILKTIDRIDPNVVIRYISPAVEKVAKRLEKTIPNLKS